MPKNKKNGSETENVRVVVRLRPLSQAELSVDNGEAVRIGPDRRSVQVLLPAEQDFAGNTRNTMKKFELDGCLDPPSSQEQTFDQSGVKDLLNAALDVSHRRARALCALFGNVHSPPASRHHR